MKSHGRHGMARNVSNGKLFGPVWRRSLSCLTKLYRSNESFYSALCIHSLRHVAWHVYSVYIYIVDFRLMCLNSSAFETWPAVEQSDSRPHTGLLSAGGTQVDTEKGRRQRWPTRSWQRYLDRARGRVAEAGKLYRVIHLNVCTFFHPSFHVSIQTPSNHPNFRSLKLVAIIWT